MPREACPTCGAPVERYCADEGTQGYTAMSDAARAGEAAVREFCRRVCRETVRETAGDDGVVRLFSAFLFFCPAEVLKEFGL